MRSFLILLLALAVGTCVSVTQTLSAEPAPPRYSIEILDRLDADRANPGPNCINERGAVVGWLQTDNSARYIPVVWQDREPIELPTFGNNHRKARDSNHDERGDARGSTADLLLRPGSL